MPQLIQASQPKNASQHTSIIKYFQGFFHRTELCLQLRTSSSVTLCWVTRTRDLSKKVFGIIFLYLPMISSKTLLFELEKKKIMFFSSLSCCTLNQELQEETQKLKSLTVCSLHGTSARTKCCFGVGNVNRSVFPFFTRQTVIIFKAGLPINIAFTCSLQRDGVGFGPGDQAFCVTPHSKQQLKHLSRFPSMGF